MYYLKDFIRFSLCNGPGGLIASTGCEPPLSKSCTLKRVCECFRSLPHGSLSHLCSHQKTRCTSWGLQTLLPGPFHCISPGLGSLCCVCCLCAGKTHTLGSEFLLLEVQITTTGEFFCCSLKPGSSSHKPMAVHARLLY